MCGRFAVTTDPAVLAERIHAVDETGGFEPNYNVAPTTDVAAVVAEAGADRRIRRMRWGLLPAWLKAGPDGEPQTRSSLINARAETAATSPAFRASARHRRCLVPMDGYYEWKRPAEPGGRKTPYYFHRDDGAQLLVAGLWSVWRADRAAPGRLSCTLITTDATAGFAAIHDRMPLLLAEADWDRWLDPGRTAPADLLGGPPAVAGLHAREVSTLVNRVANNGPELIAPADPGNQPVGL